MSTGAGGGFEVLEALVALRVSEFTEAEADMRAGIAQLEQAAAGAAIEVPFDLGDLEGQREEIERVFADIGSAIDVTLADGLGVEELQDALSSIDISGLVLPEGAADSFQRVIDNLSIVNDQAQGFEQLLQDLAGNVPEITFDNLPVDISGAEELVAELQKARDIADELGATFTLENLPEEVDGAAELVSELQAARDAADRLGEGFTIANLPVNIAGAKELVAELQAARDAADRLGDGFTPDGLLLELPGARGVIETLQNVREAREEAETFGGRFAQVSESIGSAGKSAAGLLRSGIAISGVVGGLATSIQQTNSFLISQAEELFRIEELNDRRLQQEREIADLAEDRLDAIREEGETSIAETGSADATIASLEAQIEAEENSLKISARRARQLKEQIELQEQAENIVTGDISSFSPALGNAAENAFGVVNSFRGNENLDFTLNLLGLDSLDDAQGELDTINEKIGEQNERWKALNDLIDELEKAETERANNAIESNDQYTNSINLQIARLQENEDAILSIEAFEARRRDEASNENFTEEELDSREADRERLRIAEEERKERDAARSFETEILRLKVQVNEAATGEEAAAEELNDALERRLDLEAGRTEEQADHLAQLRDEIEANERISEIIKEQMELEEDLADLGDDLREQEQQLREEGNVSSDAFNTSSGFGRQAGLINGEVDFQIDRRVQIQEDIQKTNQEIAEALQNQANFATELAELRGVLEQLLVLS